MCYLSFEGNQHFILFIHLWKIYIYVRIPSFRAKPCFLPFSHIIDRESTLLIDWQMLWNDHKLAIHSSVIRSVCRIHVSYLHTTFTACLTNSLTNVTAKKLYIFSLILNGLLDFWIYNPVGFVSFDLERIAWGIQGLVFLGLFSVFKIPE